MGKLLEHEPAIRLPSYLQTRNEPNQGTLRSAIDCTGIGVHSGCRTSMTLRPADAGTGIWFRRTDLAGAPDVPARWDSVVDTRLCTVLGAPKNPAVRIGTVEHLMAAFAGFGIDNAIVDIDGPEMARPSPSCSCWIAPAARNRTCPAAASTFWKPFG